MKQTKAQLTVREIDNGFIIMFVMRTKKCDYYECEKYFPNLKSMNKFLKKYYNN